MENIGLIKVQCYYHHINQVVISYLVVCLYQETIDENLFFLFSALLQWRISEAFTAKRKINQASFTYYLLTYWLWKTDTSMHLLLQIFFFFFLRELVFQVSSKCESKQEESRSPSLNLWNLIRSSDYLFLNIKWFINPTDWQKEPRIS